MRSAVVKAGVSGWWSGRRIGHDRHGYQLMRAAEHDLLADLSSPGCLFCREEAASAERFFFWYLAEQFFEAQAIAQLWRSQGFCRRHTAHLLVWGRPQTISRIYRELIVPAADQLHRATIRGTWLAARQTLLAALRPRGTCPACDQEAAAGGYKLFQLRAALESPQAQQALCVSSGLCLPHLVAVAPALSWGPVHAAVGSVLTQFERCLPEMTGAGQAAASCLAGLFGADLDEPARSHAARIAPPAPDRPHTAHDGGGSSAEGEADAAESAPYWTPTLGWLNDLLRHPGCPICTAREWDLRAYFDWLKAEVRTGAPRHWENALWLCRTHLWDFARSGDEEAVAILARAVAASWMPRLQSLDRALQREPPSQLIQRLLRAVEQLRQAPRFHGEQRSAAAALRASIAVVRTAAESPSSRLEKLRAQTLWRRDCPACRHLSTTAQRTSELLVRALADPVTLRRYQGSAGVCVRDLPEVLRRCPDEARFRALVKVGVARLEVLQWELDELQRKLDWSVRHELKGPEQSSWRRAVAHIAGSCVGAGALMGWD